MAIKALFRDLVAILQKLIFLHGINDNEIERREIMQKGWEIFLYSILVSSSILLEGDVLTNKSVEITSFIVSSEIEVSQEIQSIVEFFVHAKSIEWEMVFGYPIEDIRLVGNLQYGRHIDNVLEHFEAYYESEVVSEYLYYLKRSTTQTFLEEIGVFWGDSYAVIGNVYKRDATSIEYEIEYTNIEEEGDILVVSTVVTPIYYGDYFVRGKESTSFQAMEKELDFHLRKDENGEYKLTQFNEDILDAMEEEIGEEINLYQEEQDRYYPELEELEYKSEAQKEAIYYAYDLLFLYSQGGIDSIYDNYNHLWMSKIYETANSRNRVKEELQKGMKLEWLKENYFGWDYIYFLDFSSVYPVLAIAFNIDQGKITNASWITENLKKNSEYEYFTEVFKNFEDYLNEEYNMFLGQNGTIENPLELLKKYSISQFYKSSNNYIEGLPITIPSSQEDSSSWALSNNPYSYLKKELIDNPRRVDTSRFPYWKVEDNLEDFYMVIPKGKAIPNSLGGFFVFEILAFQSDFNPFEVGPINFRIMKQYSYPRINLFIYRYRWMSLERDTMNDSWKIEVFDKPIGIFPKSRSYPLNR